MNPFNKHDVATHLLERGSIFVHLDPRCATVKCPPWLKHQPQLVLQLGLNFPIPIPDLRIDEEGIFGTLSFKRCAYECFTPWDPVFVIVGDSGRGQIWHASMPIEVAAEMKSAQAASKASSAPPPIPRSKTRSGRQLPAGWRVIK